MVIEAEAIYYQLLERFSIFAKQIEDPKNLILYCGNDLKEKYKSYKSAMNRFLNNNRITFIETIIKEMLPSHSKTIKGIKEEFAKYKLNSELLKNNSIQSSIRHKLCKKIEDLIEQPQLTPDEMGKLNLSMFDFKYLMSNEQYINNNIYSYNNYRSKIQALKKKLTSYETIKEQYPDLNDWFITNSDDLENYQTYLIKYEESQDQIDHEIKTKAPSLIRSIFDMINDSDETPYYNKPTSVTIRLSHSLDCFEQLHQEQLLALQSN